MKRNHRVNMLSGVAVTVAAILMSTMVVTVSAEETNTEEPTAEGSDANNWVAMTNPLVSIEFDEDGCPLTVNPPDFYVRKQKKIIWQSVDENGASTSVQYKIFFAPFNNLALPSNLNGRVTTGVIADEVAKSMAKAEFKYTVVGDNCTDKPLDPRFRLR